MRLIVDANIIFSMLIAFGNKAGDLLFLGTVELYAPEYLLGEIWEHEQEIIDKSGFSPAQCRDALELIASKIKFILFSEYAPFISKAESICPDPDDVEYFALALSLSCPLWSNDKALASQKSVKVLSTSDLLSLLR